MIHYFPSKTWPKFVVPLLICVCLILASGCARRPRPAYQMTMLPGFPGGLATAAFDINDHGDVAGRAELPRAAGDGRAHAVVWRGGSLVDLGTPPDGGSEADRITPDGLAVGWSAVAGRRIHAVRFVSGTSVDLGISGAFATRAVSANDAGSVLVSVDRLDGCTAAMVGNHGRWAALGRLRGMRDTVPSDIGGGGEVVGTARAGGRSVAFLWRRGRLTPLRTPPGFSDTSAERISPIGVIAGTASNGAGDFHAVVWKRGAPKVLATNGANDAEAHAVNDRGEVAGSCNGRAVVWRDGRVISLNNAVEGRKRTVLLEAVGVNAQGDIVCNGVVDEIPHAFLLTPNR